VQSRQERPASHEGIEDVLCSKASLKILKILVGSQLTPSDIAERVGVCYANATKHLETLEAEGLIEHARFGKRTRYYKFSEASPKAIAVRNLIEIFET
jgi:predicted ArsR family transcriptional regulator